jgi:hypothetical protein
VHHKKDELNSAQRGGLVNKLRKWTKAHKDSGGLDKKLIAHVVAGGAAVLAPPAQAGIVHYAGPTLTSTDSGSPIDAPRFR